MATVTQSASVATNDTSIGTTAWIDPTNVYASDEQWANVSLGGSQISQYLKCTGFNFTIPTGSVINGIIVEYEASINTVNTRDNSIRIVKGGTIGSTNRADTVTLWTNTDTYYSRGGSSDLWGETWTAEDINSSNFGVAISAIRPSGSFPQLAGRIDHVRITIDYTVPAASAPTIASFTPTSGYETQSVVITGTDFGTATAVSFNGTSAASFTIDSDTQITAVLPSSVTTGLISVTNGAGTGYSATNFTAITINSQTKYPGTIVQIDWVAAFTTSPWVNVNDAKTDNETYAYCSSGGGNGYTDYIDSTNFGFTIPSDATIIGIKVEIKRKKSAGSWTDNTAKLMKAGVIVGDTKNSAVGATHPSVEVAAKGGITDLWGTTWTPSEVNASDFGFENTYSWGPGGYLYIDYFRITVYYTGGTEITTRRNGELMIL
jgi:hypothetical protein